MIPQTQEDINKMVIEFFKNEKLVFDHADGVVEHNDVTKTDDIIFPVTVGVIQLCEKFAEFAALNNNLKPRPRIVNLTYYYPYPDMEPIRCKHETYKNTNKEIIEEVHRIYGKGYEIHI